MPLCFYLVYKSRGQLLRKFNDDDDGCGNDEFSPAETTRTTLINPPMI